MPSASNNNNNFDTAKPVKQSSANSVNPGGVCGSGTKNISATAVSSEGNDSITTENITKNNTTSANANCNNKVKEKLINNVGINAATAPKNIDGIGSIETATATMTSGANREPSNDPNPMKLTITTIEHKIRNLEKRKTKLESYRAIQASGKELSSDQRAAVAKYDAVAATLEFARDLVKQMQQFTKDAEKEQKKQARKDLIAKAQAETIKIREVLIIQNVLSCFTDETIRNDFITGDNGATKLEANEMDILEKFCLDVQTRRPETAEDVPFATTAQKAAEIFSMTIDGRPKQYADTTYENVRRIFQRIQESDYLDKIYLADAPVAEQSIEEIDAVNENVVPEGEENANNQSGQGALSDNVKKVDIEATHGDSVAATDMPDTVVTNAVPIEIQMGQHLDLQAPSQQTNQQMVSGVPTLGQPLLQPPPMAPPATAVPAFQTGAPPPQAPSGTHTPVHVTLFAHQAPMQAPTPPQIPQLGAGAIITGVSHPTGPIVTGLTATSQQTVQQLPNQQRQLLNSPVLGNITTMQHLQAGAPAPPPHVTFNPTPVHAVEQSFFKQQQQQQQQQHHQQFLQQIRPLADVIGGGNFYFLQDSELDSPDLNGNVNQNVAQQSTMIYEQPPVAVHSVGTQMAAPKPNPNLPPQLLNHHEAESRNCATQQHQPSLVQQQQASVDAQQQQHQSAQPLQTHIQTQTFTNQSFPQIAPSAPVKVMGNSSAPSGSLFQAQPQPQPQQIQQQQQKLPKNQQQLFSTASAPNVLSQSTQQVQHITGGEQQQTIQEQAQSAQQTMMIITRLGAGPAPANSLNQQQLQQQQQQQTQPQSVNMPGSHNLMTANAIQQQQQQHTKQQPQQQLISPNAELANKSTSTLPKNVGFPFDNPVATGLNRSYEKQLKPQLHTVPNAIKDVVVGVGEDAKPTNAKPLANPINKSEHVTEWNETTNLINRGGGNASNQVINSDQDLEGEPKKFINESNIGSVQITQQQQQQQQQPPPQTPTLPQPQTRKNEWTSSGGVTASSVSASDAAGGGDGGGGNTSYGGREDRSESNPWHAQQESVPQGGYGRGTRTGGGGNYIRREDRRAGGTGSVGTYRGNRSNYGSTGPQNGNNGPRGGGGGNGVYYRNNDNGNNNSYYQNGGNSGGNGSHMYNSHKETPGHRYESGSGGGNSGGNANFRGPRNSGSGNGTNARYNASSMHRSMGSGRNTSSGGAVNSAPYTNSRQPNNRISSTLEKKN